MDLKLFFFPKEAQKTLEDRKGKVIGKRKRKDEGHTLLIPSLVSGDLF